MLTQQELYDIGRAVIISIATGLELLPIGPSVDYQTTLIRILVMFGTSVCIRLGASRAATALNGGIGSGTSLPKPPPPPPPKLPGPPQQ